MLAVASRNDSAEGSKLFLVPPVAAQQDRSDGKSDADLVASFLAGHARAPAMLWDRYFPFVRRILQRSMGPGQDLEDLVQEVFLRLFRKLPTLRDPALLKGFILVIATRVVQTELRVRWFRRWLGLFEDGTVPDRAAQEGDDHDAREALGRFYRLLDGLSPQHRTAFVLRYVEGLELTEVAAAVDVSLATIKRWLPRIARRVFSQANNDPVLANYMANANPFAVSPQADAGDDETTFAGASGDSDGLDGDGLDRDFGDDEGGASAVARTKRGVTKK